MDAVEEKEVGVGGILVDHPLGKGGVFLEHGAELRRGELELLCLKGPL